MLKVKRTLYLSIGLMCLLAACGSRLEVPQAELDTPQHRVYNGYTLLESGKIDAAFYEFSLARELDPKYAPAYTGLGLVEVYRCHFDTALKTMNTTRSYSGDDEHRYAVGVGFMRVYIIGGEKIDNDWLARVKEEFITAKEVAPEKPEAYFYMGIAYKLSLEFTKATDQFERVLTINKGLAMQAAQENARVQKIEWAKPVSVCGKKIALLEQINRADVVALFVEELKLAELLTKRTLKMADTSRGAWGKETVSRPVDKTIPATDINSHIFNEDINALIAIGIKGLKLCPDQTFRPEKVVSRSEFAIMIEDILIRLTGADGLATQFVSNRSPFPDLQSDRPGFNAAMTCTTRGIMAVKNSRTGAFDPLGPISGAEALSSIRVLKTQF